MIIDAHLHVWDRGAARYDWLGSHLPEVDRDIHIGEIAPTLAHANVTGVILVQSADNAEDTRHMLRVADENPMVLGVVGWAPIEDPAAARSHLDELTQNQRIIGIRNLIHDRDDPDWVLRPEFADGLSLLAERGLPFDFVTSDPGALSRLVQIGADHPRLVFILDHLGKPPIDGHRAGLLAWEDMLREVAALPNVVSKVSGLYAAAGPQSSWTQDQIDHVIDTAVDAFGPERLMYGGDWPMSLRAGGYGRVLAGLRHAVRTWPDEAKQHFWWRTAAHVYRLPTVTAY